MSFGKLFEERKITDVVTQAHIIEEYEEFKNIRNKQKNFWSSAIATQKCPTLLPIALQYLTLPPSSASAERAASFLRYIQGDKRHSLSAEKVNEELFYCFNGFIVAGEMKEFVRNNQ